MSLSRRLDKLEKRSGAAGEGVLGVQRLGGMERPSGGEAPGGEAGAPVSVRGEKMSEAAFRERYPAGTLVRVIYADDAPEPDGVA